MPHKHCPWMARIQPIILVLLIGGLFVSSFYINCLEHAVGIDLPGHNSGVASTPSVTDNAEKPAHDHPHGHRHESPNRDDNSETEPPIEPCHHRSHAAAPTLALETVCDRCLSMASLSVPELNADALALLPQETGARDPYWSRLDRPPTSFN